MSIHSIASVRAAQDAQINENVRKPQEVQPPDRNIASAVADANQSNLFGQSNELAFAADRRTGTFIARLIDRATGTVVRQVPTEEVLSMMSRPAGDVFEMA